MVTSSEERTLRETLAELYFGASSRALRFQTLLLVLDVILIAFFVASPFLERTPLVLTIDYAIAALLAADLTARAVAYRSIFRWFTRPIVWADLIVLISLLFPFWVANLAFLRILRAFSLINSPFFWNLLAGGRWANSETEDRVKAVANLLIFIFMMTGLVHSSFASRAGDIHSYVESLYFTVTSLTTTGYGDITLPGTWGRLLSIFIMVAGLSLFVRLAQVILRPHKVVHPCPTCGLQRHDPDAVHCKACGRLLNIADDDD